jgi:hypothetical protein
MMTKNMIILKGSPRHRGNSAVLANLAANAYFQVHNRLHA